MIQLSYTSLLQSVVVVLSCTQIQYHSSRNNSSVFKLVWLADPSIEYFRGKHIPLALVAVMFGVFILAYTLVLLCVQPLQRYSHFRCFSWVARLKPLIDAYTAPHIIKDSCRWWEGLLLFLRLFLSVVFTTNIRNRVDVNLTAITTIVLIVLTISWSVSGIYKKIHLNALNSVSICNLAIISIAVTNFSPLTHTAKYYRISTNTSVAVFALLSLMILGHGIYRRMKVWYTKYKRRMYQAMPSDVTDTMPPLRQFPDSLLSILAPPTVLPARITMSL